MSTTTSPTTGTTMTPEGFLTLARWLSPSFPVGAFAWSHGLESAVADGAVHDAETLADWLDAVLTLGSLRSDAILLGAAWRAGPDALPDIADLACALASPAERRAETLAQGAAFAATVRAVHGFDLPDMAYPVAVGRAAALAGLPLDPTAQLYLQATVSTLIQAAQRLMPLGQTAAAGVLARLAPACASVAAKAVTLDTDDIGSATVAIDIAAMRHEALAPRLFRS